MSLAEWLEREEPQFQAERVAALLTFTPDKLAWTRLVDDHGLPLGEPIDRAAFYAASQADLAVLRSLDECKA